jgi:hypothetical protein
MTNVITTIEFTRAQRLANECTHEQYYNQFVNDVIINRVKQYIGKDNIIAALATDKGLNSIPLAKWDGVANNLYNVSAKMKEAGDYLTLAGGVCIAKAAARIIATA